MISTIQALINALLIPLVISIITAITTVRLSIRQSQSEKWWERKAETYSQIMEQLTLLEISYGAWYDDAISVNKLNDEERRALSGEHRRAEELVRRAAAAGSYIVSPEAALVLIELVKEFDRHVPGKNWVDELGRHYQSTRTCIAKLRDCAKVDLSRR